jgi:hypothetical protein
MPPMRGSCEPVPEVIPIDKRPNVIVLAEYQAVSTGKQGKPLGQNVYGAGRTTGWK